jgi:hypothetical protein
MARFEDHRRRAGCAQCLGPALHAQAPAIAFRQAEKTKLGHGRGEIVAAAAGELEELTSHPGAHRVQPEVARSSPAIAIAKITSRRIHAAGTQRAAEDIGEHAARWMELASRATGSRAWAHHPLRRASIFRGIDLASARR